MTVSVFDYEIFNESLERCVEQVANLAAQKNLKRVVTLNPQILVGGECNSRMKQWLQTADCIVADGMGIVWGAKSCHYLDLTCITGVELAAALLRAGKGSVYFVGGDKKVIKKAVKKTESDFPNMTIAGAHHGYISGFEMEDIAKDIAEKKPTYIFVGMGFPKQEYFIEMLSRYCSSGVAIGVGGFFDILSEEKRRAPQWIRNLSLEWLYRGLSEPRRILTWGFLFQYIIFVLAKKCQLNPNCQHGY